MKYKALDKILEQSDYSHPADIYILNLMKKFELCYEIDDETVLIPNLLEVGEPEIDFEYDNCLRFVIEYGFLPKSVIPRFIVRMHKDIKGQLRWRTGVVLEDEDFVSKAVIRADGMDKKIYIYVSGKYKRDYLSVIRKVFMDINDSFGKLNVRELVVLPDSSETTIAYKELLGHDRSGKTEVFVGMLGKSYSVKALLEGIEHEENGYIGSDIEISRISDEYVSERANGMILDSSKLLDKQEVLDSEKEVYLKQAIKMPKELRGPLKQYLVYFSEFVEKSKGVKISFEVHSTDDGLELLLGEEFSEEIANINIYLEEYTGFIRENIGNLTIYADSCNASVGIGHFLKFS